MQQVFSLLVKPVACDCNLRCRYCFYLPTEAYFGRGAHRMSDAVLERMIAGYLRTPQPHWTIGWQGGEPTLASVDFFRRAVAWMRQYAPPGATVANALQTNGTLLDDEWGAFLASHRFLVGLSIDGPPELHDANRVTATGAGSHEAVLRGMDVLRRNRVEFNVLTLVNSLNVRHPLEVYRYLRDELQVLFHQYIECVEYEPDGTLRPFAVGGREWGEFLCTIFDEWYAHDVRKVSVRLFDSILHRILYGVPNTCAMGRRCGTYLVVEHDGGVYPCDFFVRPEWRLGRIGDREMGRFFEHPVLRALARRKEKTPAECRSCRWFRFCAGDCVKNRNTENRSALCSGWKMFYEHACDRLEALAETLK